MSQLTSWASAGLRKVAVILGESPAFIRSIPALTEVALFRRAWRLKVPLVMAVASYFALSQVSQIWELYADFKGDFVQDIARGTVVLTLLLAVALTLSIAVSISTLRAGLPPPVPLFGDRCAQCLTSIAPLIGFQGGTVQYVDSRFSYEFKNYLVVLKSLQIRFPDLPELRAFGPALLGDQQSAAGPSLQMSIMNIICFFLIILFLLPFVHRWADHFVQSRGGRNVGRLYAASVLASLTLVGVFSAINLPPLSGAVIPAVRTIGALPVILVFFCLLTLHLVGLAQLSAKRHYPLILLLAAASLVFASLDLNDNHRIASELARPTKWESRSPAQWLGGPAYRLPFLEEEFAEWFERRPIEEKARFADRPYPVFIVAAEGGGAYAAVQTGVFLARLFDQCPALAHHVFAVSGVSGGSVGAAAFAGAATKLMEAPPLAGNERCRPAGLPAPIGKLESAARLVLGKDHLAPVVAVALFPDFIQRFLPFAVDSFDRARALESSLAQSWPTGSANPFKESIRATWDAGGRSPLLLLNTVSVERGSQLAIAPIESPRPFNEDSLARFRSFFSQHGDDGTVPSSYDVTLGTAAGLSARFPGISPPGRHENRDHPDEWGEGVTLSDNFVDGGYVDNSGVEVAHNTIALLQWFIDKGRPSSTSQQFKTLAAPKQRIEFHLIAIGGESKFTSHWSYTQSWTTGLMAPLVALLNSRSTRASTAREAASHAEFDFMQVSLPWNFVKPPLGWKLNASTIDLITASIGHADLCDPIDMTSTDSFSDRVNEVVRALDPNLPKHNMVSHMFEFHGIIRHNHCTARKIVDLVR